MENGFDAMYHDTERKADALGTAEYFFSVSRPPATPAHETFTRSENSPTERNVRNKDNFILCHLLLLVRKLRTRAEMVCIAPE